MSRSNNAIRAPKKPGVFQRSLGRCLVALALGVSAWPALAQSDYPNRPVKIISPHTPGMGTDAVLRGIAQVLSVSMGRPFVVENRPGADGIIAGDACARAPADGYTLCMGDSLGIMLSPLIKASMPYDPDKAFEPITLMAFLPAGFFIRQSLPAKTFEELMAYAKANPGKVNIGTFGRASPPYLYSQLLRETKGIQFNEVPYKSSGESWRALLAGEVDATTFTLATGMVQAQQRARLAATSTASRIAESPETPTYEEVGLQKVTTWIALFAPAGTPKPIIDRLYAEIAKGFYANSGLVHRLIEGGGYIVQGAVGKPPAAAGEFLEQQRSMYVGLVKSAKIGRE